jgi:TonB family protein
MPALPSTGFSAGNLQFESGDYDWDVYGHQIYLAIWQAWHRRLHGTTESFERFAHERSDWLLDNSARIRFTILRSGQVVDVAVEDESGCPPLDDSAVDALREVVLPPLPTDFPRGSETVHGRFIATGDIRGMRRTLEYLKRAGYF